MEQTRATRTDLLARKSQMALASQGAKLLKSKREALLKDLMQLIRPLVAAHEDLEGRVQQATRSLTFAEAFDGSPYLRSLARGAGGNAKVGFEEQSYWGVRIPALSVAQEKPPVIARDVSPSGLKSGAVQATSDFDRLLHGLLRLAPLQIRLARLGAEVRSTSRRVNALDQVVIPGLQRDIKMITQALEEVEREDLFRLRRIKKKKDASARKTAEVERGRLS